MDIRDTQHMWKEMAALQRRVSALEQLARGKEGGECPGCGYKSLYHVDKTSTAPGGYGVFGRPIAILRCVFCDREVEEPLEGDPEE